MTRADLIREFYRVSPTEQSNRIGDGTALSMFYKYLEDKGYLEKNGVYHMPSIYLSVPEAHGRNLFWDKMDYSKYQSLFRMKKATRFSKEPLSYADFLSIRYVYSGTDAITTPTAEFNLSRNDICLMNAGFISSQYLANEDDIVFTLMIERDYLIKNVVNPQVSGSILSRFIYDYVLTDENPRNYIIFHAGDNDRLPRLMEDIVMEYTHPTELGQFLLEAYLQILLIEMTHAKYEFAQTKSGSIAIRFAEIIHDIDENYQTITLNELSRRYGYNSDYISRRIEKMTGTTFKDYVLNKKMEQACHMLSNSNLSIQEILTRCGFSGETAFYRKFREQKKMTPKQYRSRFRIK